MPHRFGLARRPRACPDPCLLSQPPVTRINRAITDLVPKSNPRSTQSDMASKIRFIFEATADCTHFYNTNRSENPCPTPIFFGTIALSPHSHHNFHPLHSYISGQTSRIPHTFFFPTAPPSPGMQMYCQSPSYVVCPNNPIYPPDRSSPPPAHPITPQAPRSVSFFPQLEQVCTDILFTPNPPLSSPPSSSPGTISSSNSSPYSSPVERFVGDDYPYPYVPFVEPQQ